MRSRTWRTSRPNNTTRDINNVKPRGGWASMNELGVHEDGPLRTGYEATDTRLLNDPVSQATGHSL